MVLEEMLPVSGWIAFSRYRSILDIRINPDLAEKKEDDKVSGMY